MNVAIVTGGPSAEREISLNSAKLIAQYLDPDKYSQRTIVIEEGGWFDQDSGSKVDQNDFSLTVDGSKQSFDLAYLIVHGTPVEDGKLQGYFESKGILHTTCDTLTSALAFNKQWCKDFLAYHNVPMAKSEVVRSDAISEVDPTRFDYPVFVKPNNNGSSYGVSKVTSDVELPAALAKAAEYDHEIMVEQFMAGREFSSGAVWDGKTLHVFPITEMLPDGEFFDYEAKYLGAGKEITPAHVEAELSDKCRAQTARLYKLLKCRGIVRFDYIMVGSEFWLLEANTVPGMSEASIVPQQARAYGWTITELLDRTISGIMST